MSSSSNAQQVVQHNEYFLDGGDLYLVVAHTLFRVHSYFFLRESQIFRDIMTAPVPVGQVRQGGIDSAAIMVKGVTVEEFAKFLWVFYNKVYGVHNATLPEWLAILKLAQEYQFPEVKRLATSKLEAFEMPIAERIALYQNHMVDPMYLVPLYVKLCKRDEGPSDDETAIMGIKTSLIIFRAREKSISSPDDNDITRAIYSLFGFNPQTGTSSHTNHKGRVNGKSAKGGSS
ncbi:hypothetical protein BYT27DRAFT_6758326 [Phlegmacium glaucopus]|nr:hypothetical protein BYT27DRAFT_6758326 [Phlegmacium glaucopus]